MNTALTDPLDRDTDDGGSTDGAEVLVDKTDPLDPSDDVCTFVDVSVDDPIDPAGPDFDPIWIGVEFELNVGANGVNDFAIDEDGSGTIETGEAFTSALILNLYGPEVDRLCSVIYEADWSASTELFDEAGWNTDGNDLFEAYRIAASGGVTDCPSLDEDVYGNSDIRDVLADLDWGVGIGGHRAPRRHLANRYRKRRAGLDQRLGTIRIRVLDQLGRYRRPLAWVYVHLRSDVRRCSTRR